MSIVAHLVTLLLAGCAARMPAGAPPLTATSFPSEDTITVCPREHARCFLYFYSVYCPPSKRDLEGPLREVASDRDAPAVYIIDVDGLRFRSALRSLVEHSDVMGSFAGAGRFAVDRDNQLANRFGVERVPAVVEVRHGTPVKTVVGETAVDLIVGPGATAE